MDKVASLPSQDRRELFEATAEKRRIHAAIIEKDFWVCWVLKRLFASPELMDDLVFKGGTSLSKVYRLIHRFSEDIDLVLNWELLGYGPKGLDPWKEHLSRTKQIQFNEDFNKRANAYINDNLQPRLARILSGVPGIEPVVSTQQQVIDVRYPAAFALDVLRPEVKLEIGPLASWTPSERSTIRPYAAEEYEEIFNEPDCPVVAIKAERTFWEKATILHQQAHRSTPMSAGYSRHYYDLYQLANSPIKVNALADLGLLEDVVIFKLKFYPCNWAKYEDAKVGTFRLMPTEAGRRELQADYRRMQDMIFGDAPLWGDILELLSILEQEINDLE